MADLIRDHKAIASEGLIPSIKKKFKHASIATLGILALSIPIPPEIKVPVDGGGNFTYIVDGELLPRPYDMFHKKAIIIVEIDGIEFRAVVEKTFDINSIRSIEIDNIDIENPIAKLFVSVDSVEEIKPIIEAKLLEVKNEYTNKVEIKFI